MKKWKAFAKHHPRTALAIGLFGFWLVLALLAPILANDKPLLVIMERDWYFPSLTNQRILVDHANHQNYDLERMNMQALQQQPFLVILSPIPFSPNTFDLQQAHFRPPSTLHLLGTNGNGQDVLANILHGARASLGIGLLAVLFTTCIGLLLGVTAGYFGNAGFRTNYALVSWWLLGLFSTWFYAFYLPNENQLLRGFLMVAFWYVTAGLGKTLLRSRVQLPRFMQLTIPIDLLVSGVIQLVTALPKLVLVLAFAAIMSQSATMVVMLIALVSWTTIARLTRAETQKWRISPMLEALQLYQVPKWRILLLHLLPNVLAPALVTITFGLGSAILLEASLSFLGIGLPAEMASWGKLLQQARHDMQAWWMMVFPGLALFSVLWSINQLGNHFRAVLNPSLQSRIS